MISASDSKAALGAALEALAREQRARGIEPPALSLDETRRLAADSGASLRQVEVAALERRILPERYRRNLGTVGWEGQLRLLQSHVAVVGAGGLGGWIIDLLARMGVGTLTIIDGDHFQDNNLNRQLGCSEASLGQPKAALMAERVQAVNAAVDVRAHVAWLTEANGRELLAEADVIVDALDTLPARLMLERTAAALERPLVHGAIGGYTGQVMTIYPGDPGLRGLYGEGPVPERGIETELGNPAATPMMISAWEVQEVVKIIVGRGQLLRHRMLLFDAETGQATEVELA